MKKIRIIQQKLCKYLVAKWFHTKFKEWPPQSSGLNPIQIFWALIDYKVRDRKIKQIDLNHLMNVLKE